MNEFHLGDDNARILAIEHVDLPDEIVGGRTESHGSPRELLTGHRLFAGRNDLAVLERVRDAVIDPPPRFYRPDLSRELETIVLRSLAREADDRFQSTSELHEALYNYTFKKGVVVTGRTLSKFLHELFLVDETEEH